MFDFFESEQNERSCSASDIRIINIILSKNQTYTVTKFRHCDEIYDEKKITEPKTEHDFIDFRIKETLSNK